MPTRKKTDIIQLSKVRMREALRAKLDRDAKRKGITLNAEIVERLERSYESEANALRDSTIVDLAELTQRVVGLLGSGQMPDGTKFFSPPKAHKRFTKAIQDHRSGTPVEQTPDQPDPPTVADRGTDVAGALRRDLEALETRQTPTNSKTPTQQDE